MFSDKLDLLNGKLMQMWKSKKDWLHSKRKGRLLVLR